MEGAFLHKRSLLDLARDQRDFKNPITQRKTARSWDNPITRREREHKIQRWAGSFAGRRHYRKLARFNAMHESSYNPSIRLKIEDGDSPKMKKFMRKYAGKSIEVYFDDLDKQLPANFTDGQVKSGYIPQRYWGQWDAYCNEYGCRRNEGRRGKAAEGYVPGFEEKVADVLCGGEGVDQGELQSFFDSNFSFMYDLEDSTDLTFSEKAKLVLAKFREWSSKPSEAAAKVSPYLTEIAWRILKKDYGWTASTLEEVAEWLADHKQAFEHAYGESLRVTDDDNVSVKAGVDAVLAAEDDAVARAEIAGESLRNVLHESLLKKLK